MQMIAPQILSLVAATAFMALQMASAPCYAGERPLRSDKAGPKYKGDLRSISATKADGRINVGGTYQHLWVATCRDANGNPVADTVTWNVSGAPTTGGATASFSPNPTQTFQNTEMSIVTTSSTSPGSYTMIISVTGTVCSGYPTGTRVLDVAPLIGGDALLWWFDGSRTELAYATRTWLTSSPAGYGPYLWTVNAGSNKVSFIDGTTSASTPNGTVQVQSIGGSSTQNDVSVVVKVNGVESDPLSMTVRMPNSMTLLSNNDFTDSSYVYRSEIRYTILDQFGVVLPASVRIQEHFTTPPINDYPGADWRRGNAGGGPVNPANWADSIQGEEIVSIPQPLPPQTPLSTTNVQHWDGNWRVGGSRPGAGRRVQTNTWQKYLDHARHTQVVSPAP